MENLFSKGSSSNPAGSFLAASGVETPAMKGEAKAAADKEAAAAAAAVRQAEFEASAKAGLERIALRRRRGFAASMIVDPGSSLGTSSTLGS